MYAPDACAEAVRRQFHAEVLERSAVLEQREIVMALGALLDYLKRTQITGLERMEEINVYTEAKAMRLDLQHAPEFRAYGDDAQQGAPRLAFCGYSTKRKPRWASG